MRDLTLDQYNRFNEAEHPETSKAIGKAISSVFWGSVSISSTILGGLKTTLCCDCRRAVKKISNDLLNAVPNKALVELTSHLQTHSFLSEITASQLSDLLSILLYTLENPKSSFPNSLTKSERANLVSLADSFS